MEGDVLRIDDKRRVRDYNAPGAYSIEDTNPYANYSKSDFVQAAKMVALSPNTTNGQKALSLQVLQKLDPKTGLQVAHYIHQHPPKGFSISAGLTTAETVGLAAVVGVGAVLLAPAAVGALAGYVGTSVGAVGSAIGTGATELYNAVAGFFGGGHPNNPDPNHPNRSLKDSRTYEEQLCQTYPIDPLYASYAGVFPYFSADPQDSNHVRTVFAIAWGLLENLYNAGLMDQNLFELNVGGWFFSYGQLSQPNNAPYWPFCATGGANANGASFFNWGINTSNGPVTGTNPVITPTADTSGQIQYIPGTSNALAKLNIGASNLNWKLGMGAAQPTQFLTEDYYYLVTPFTDGTVRLDAVAPITDDEGQLAAQLSAITTGLMASNNNLGASSLAQSDTAQNGGLTSGPVGPPVPAAGTQTAGTQTAGTQTAGTQTVGAKTAAGLTATTGMTCAAGVPVTQFGLLYALLFIAGCFAFSWYRKHHLEVRELFFSFAQSWHGKKHRAKF